MLFDEAVIEGRLKDWEAVTSHHGVEEISRQRARSVVKSQQLAGTEVWEELEGQWACWVGRMAAVLRIWASVFHEP